MARGDFPSSKQEQFMLRFPDGMRDRIREEAEKNGRSMNAEIIHRLQSTLDMDSYVAKVNVHTDETSIADLISRMESILVAAKKIAGSHD